MVGEKKKKIIIIVSIIIALSLSFVIYNIIAKADADADRVAIKNVSITGIDTGSGNFDNDGLDYSNSSSYTRVDGYIAGSDSNKKNRIVRSFDTITYHFDYSITGKELGYDFEERMVSIKVTLSEENAKYVTFSNNSVAGETTHTYVFEGIDSYGSFQNDITLYVLGAPNGMNINPKFEIQESTNTDANYIVSLGSISFESNEYNYTYNNEKSNKYSNKPTNSDFINYMPTITSSKAADIRLKVIGHDKTQKATYNSQIGRYLTYVIGLEIVGDEAKGIKGYSMPNLENINFNIGTYQNGINNDVIIESNWLRLYGSNSVDGIEPVVTSIPYSSSGSSNKISNPGNISIIKNNNTYTATISDYNILYSPIRVSANGEEISKAEHYIGTYALTVFSPRDIADNKNDIEATINLTNGVVKDTQGVDISIPNTSASIINKYYEVIDYSLTGQFYDLNNAKLSEQNGEGSLSKGSELIFKTTFNYKKTLSDQGLKEVIKIDPNAFRVISNSEKDVRISIITEDDLNADDFDILFVSGDFKNTNYSSSIPVSRLSNEDLLTVQGSCSIVQEQLGTYSDDNIMNLYGGPCIMPNESTERMFTKISEAQEDGKEVPITKIIIQTKEGVNLPDEVKIVVDVRLRVRNVSDLTRTYQATVMASSSDYDSKLTYYSPRITNDENSITNPNNYNKTLYQGNEIIRIDNDSVWGDTLKIVNFTSRQEITVKNKNTDGSTKINYNVSDGETLNFNIKTIIQDKNESVGADDVWYINKLKVYVTVPSGLIYVEDKKLGTPEVINNPGGPTMLIYTLPYTKPNMKINDINFKAIISPEIQGTGVALTVTSTVDALNINNEKDTSYFERLTGAFTVYVTGIQNVILSQKIGEQGSVVEKNSEFSYLIGAYNNTSNDVTDYEIMNTLPSNGDKNGSVFKGSYKVKLILPSSLGKAIVTCSNQNYNKLYNEVSNSLNQFNDCNILDEYVDATAIKISNISINANSYMDQIKLLIKPINNEYDDRYINSYIGGSKSFSQNESNKIEIKVVSRKISGRIFVDLNENGIEDEEETYLKNVPVSLYKLDSNNNVKKIEETLTNENGEYYFKDLDVGRYKIRANIDSNTYDLTLRYATQDTVHDSDGYKIDENIIEISNKRTPDEPDGIRVTRDIETVENMNIGLIYKKTFGFDIYKYITKIELINNGVPSTLNYDNQSKVVLNVRNFYSARVYYGIRITNNSTQAGYVKKVDESIPNGMRFSDTDVYNSDWIYTNGSIQSISLENELIQPGETKYLKIALDVPTTSDARTFINEAAILEIEPYEPEGESEDRNADSNSYEFGEAVTYAGIDWHVIDVQNIGDGEQILTLLGDSETISQKMSNINDYNSIYKWSDSPINRYLNSRFISQTNLDIAILRDNVICDDASGLPVATYGGSLQSEGLCQSGIYTTTKVRLLTEREFNQIMANAYEDKSWLNVTKEFWIMNSVFIEQQHDPYGRLIESTNASGLSKYVSNSATIQNADAKLKKEVRPVITISNKNIISE